MWQRNVRKDRNKTERERERERVTGSGIMPGKPLCKMHLDAFRQSSYWIIIRVFGCGGYSFVPTGNNMP